MKRLASLVCLVSAAFAAGLTQGERDRAMSELHATRKQFLDAVAGLSPAQWNFKPDPKTSSIAEIAARLIDEENTVFVHVTDRILKSPGQPRRKSPVNDEQVLQEAAARGRNLQPAASKPGPGSQAEAVDRFRQIRDRTIAYVRDTPDDLRSHFAAHPVFGELDAYQWILMVAGETSRYVQQIDRLKQNPRFPKK